MPKYRSILPAEPSGGPPPPPEQVGTSASTDWDARLKSAPKRPQVLAACQRCRIRKIKCDAKRPVCGRCAVSDQQCTYEVLEGETTRLALKRRQLALENEVLQYKELFEAIRTRNPRDASDIYNRLRESHDPLSLLQSIRQADLLIPNPTPTGWTASPVLIKLDREALQASPIKVSAKPWTTVASDSIVSELISNFFAWDNEYLFPAFDQDAFVADMALGVVEDAKWCSPLLVNAMCAQRSLVVERAKVFGKMTNQNMAESFLQEANALLDREQGRASIPTVQALVLMYLTTASMGRDRAASMYRLAAYEMLKRLNLERRFQRARDARPQRLREMTLLSKAVWGILLLESRGVCFYHRPVGRRPAPRCPAAAAPSPPDNDVPYGSDDVGGDVLLVSGILSEVCVR